MTFHRVRPFVTPRLDALEPRFLFAAIEFEPVQKYPTGIPPGAAHVAAGDFNRDGVQDLLAAGDETTVTPVEQHTVRVLPGLGGGRFGTPGRRQMVGTAVSGVAVADFNRDGRLDVAVSNNTRRGTVQVLLGNGDGSFQPGTSYYSGSFSTGVAAADFDRDGDVDLMVSNKGWWTSPEDSLRPAVHGAAFLPNNGDGTFGPEDQVMGMGPTDFVEAGDVNNDRVPDAVFGHVNISFGDLISPESGVIPVMSGGDGTFRVGPRETVGGEITGMAVGDVNGDGRLDVALALSFSFMESARAHVLEGDGIGNFHDGPRAALGQPVSADVVIVDLDGDGRRDVAAGAYNPASAAPVDVGTVVALPNRGGVFGEPTVAHLQAWPAGMAAGLFNDDRLPDLAVALPRHGQVGVLINNTPSITASGTVVTATAGTPLVNRPVARFRITGSSPDAPANPIDDDPVFVTRVYWGDGTRSEGRVVRNDDGSFSVLGSHTYRRPGVYRILVVIAWPDGGVQKLAVSRAVVRAPLVRTT
ncbi:MAG TPA: VCBS repeat-containing protein [Tepidisphaeraceae bacterium]|nr:VCBS repeat-containing protein [Tepidisphaeraceae bacterium]